MTDQPFPAISAKVNFVPDGEVRVRPMVMIKEGVLILETRTEGDGFVIEIEAGFPDPETLASILDMVADGLREATKEGTP